MLNFKEEKEVEGHLKLNACVGAQRALLKQISRNLLWILWKSKKRLGRDKFNSWQLNNNSGAQKSSSRNPKKIVDVLPRKC